MNAKTRPQARSAARRVADRWQDTYSKAVDCLRNDLDELLACFRYKTLEERKAVPPSSADSAKSAAGPGPWASSQTEPPWTASGSPSSPTKTQPRECLPSSP